MLKVGLTGSIAVGKSYVCTLLEEFGCHVLDADLTARDVVRPGTKGLELVVSSFGREILDSNEELDRVALGSIVFQDESKRQLLNSILHPLIIEAQDEWLLKKAAADPNGIAVIDAALMIESGSYARFEELIVVWCESDIQLSRLMSRDSIDFAAASRKIEAQMSQEEKKKYATILIDTSGGFEETGAQTAAVFKLLKEKAGHN